MKQKIFQYSILWHPNPAQIKEGRKTTIISQPTNILSIDQQSATLAAAMTIPAEHREELDQIEIAIRPF